MSGAAGEQFLRVALNGEVIGEMTLEEAARRISAGELAGDLYYFAVGPNAWQPLRPLVASLSAQKAPPPKHFNVSPGPDGKPAMMTVTEIRTAFAAGSLSASAQYELQAGFWGSITEVLEPGSFYVKPGIVSVCQALGFLNLICTAVAGIALLGNGLVSLGVGMIVSGVIGGTILIALGSIVEFLARISHQTRVIPR